MIETLGHPEIYECPGLTSEDTRALSEIHDMRRSLADVLRTPKRWSGSVRRAMLARAIRGSNSIEGYVVAEDDAAAALDDEEPLSADESTFAEILGYRDALGYVLQMADDPIFSYDTSSIRSMHYMMLGHDLTKSPGRYRAGPIYVVDEKTDTRVYEGPPAEDVPALMEAFTQCLRDNIHRDPIVQGAMAHLNLVMLHPFRDGNGRMARALQTLVLSRQAIAEPAFSSIEEWLGVNTEDYYRVLAITGKGHWAPRPDAHLWISFNIRAHHMQAQTVARRIDDAAAIWEELDELALEHSLPERTIGLLYEAVLGYRIRRSSYTKTTKIIDDRTATRDLARLTGVGLLHAVGVTRSRHYVAGDPLIAIRRNSRSKRRDIVDPFPWMKAKLASGEDHQT